MCGISGHYCTAGTDRGLVERMAPRLSHLWHVLQSLVLSHKLTPHELVTEFSGTPISFSA